MTDDNPLLKISVDECDGGELVGERPDDVPSELLSLNFSARNPLKAIRAKCLDCCCGHAAEVRKCVATDCPLWPFRLGTNPFRQKSALSNEERKRRASRLRRASEKNMR
jgi:hypothetical protein